MSFYLVYRGDTWRTAALFLLILVMSARADAGLLYSIDVDTDELVTIDTTNGNVAVVGATGVNLTIVDLAVAGGQLFALDSRFNDRVDLYTLSTSTGAATSAVQVRDSAGTIGHAEGLASIGGQLKIGYRHDATAPALISSNALGDLSPGTGLITNEQTSASVDIDALTYDVDNAQLYSVDVTAAAANYQSVDQAPFDANTFFSDGQDLAIFGIAVFDDTLFAVGGNDRLYSLDLATNAFTHVALSRSGTYEGLANAASIPEPPVGGLLAIGAWAAFLSSGKRLAKVLSEALT